MQIFLATLLLLLLGGVVVLSAGRRGGRVRAISTTELTVKDLESMEQYINGDGGAVTSHPIKLTEKELERMQQEVAAGSGSGGGEAAGSGSGGEGSNVGAATALGTAGSKFMQQQGLLPAGGR